MKPSVDLNWRTPSSRSAPGAAECGEAIRILEPELETGSAHVRERARPGCVSRRPHRERRVAPATESSAVRPGLVHSGGAPPTGCSVIVDQAMIALVNRSLSILLARDADGSGL